MTTKIRLADNLTLPIELVTESVGILAVKRAGKSHTAKKLTEQLHRAGQQVVVVDPKGDWWGLRSSADGKSPGLPFVVLGGEHGDVPIEPGAGELVAKLVVEQRVSLVLDLSELRKHQVSTFMVGFLETLYRMKAKDQYRTPMMLVIDEADAIAPQSQKSQEKGGNEARMLGAAEDIVRRGGQRGIGIILVSQRAAVLNKNVLTQVGVLMLLRTTGKQDIEAVKEWIKYHGQPAEAEQVLATIATMPRGTAWVWAPGWPTEAGIFQQVQIGRIDTFDSGATPKPGERQLKPKTVADVDLEAFRREMAATIEKAKQEDPRELRKELAVVRQQLTVAQKKLQVPAPSFKETGKRVDVPVLKEGQLARVDRFGERLVAFGTQMSQELPTQIGEKIAAAVAPIIIIGREITTALARLQQPTNGSSRPTAAPRPVVPPRPALQRMAPRARTEGANAAGEVRPRAGARRMLEAIARRYPVPTSEAQCAQLAKVKRSGGTFGTYKSDLLRGGFMAEARDGLELTDLGWEAIGVTPGQASPQTTDDVLALYAGTIRAGARRMIDALMEVYPGQLSRAQLSEQASVALEGGTFGTYLSDLRKAGLVEDQGDYVGASELLMNPGGAEARR